MDQQREKRFEYLFRTQYANLCRYIKYWKHLDEEIAKQIASDALLLLYRKWEQVNVANEVDVRKWLHKTAELMCLDHFKHVRSRPSLVQTEDDFFNAIVDNDLAEELREEASYQALLDHIREHLSEDEWCFFEHAFVNNESTQRLSQVFGQTENTIYSRRKRVREKTQKILKNYKDL